MVKNLRALQETWVQSLGLEDPLKKGIMLLYFIMVLVCISVMINNV